MDDAQALSDDHFEKPVFDLSSAKHQLCQDVMGGEHKAMKPIELHKICIEYMESDLAAFQKRI